MGYIQGPDVNSNFNVAGQTFFRKNHILRADKDWKPGSMRGLKDEPSWSDQEQDEEVNNMIAATRGTKQMRAFAREINELQSDGEDNNERKSSDDEANESTEQIVQTIESERDPENDDGEAPKLTCSYCDKEFNKAFNRKRHEFLVHDNKAANVKGHANAFKAINDLKLKNENSELVSELEESKNRTCKYCNKEFSRKDGKDRHERKRICENVTGEPVPEPSPDDINKVPVVK